MSEQRDRDDARWVEELGRTLPAPSAEATAKSRARVDAWYEVGSPDHRLAALVHPSRSTVLGRRRSGADTDQLPGLAASLLGRT